MFSANDYMSKDVRPLKEDIIISIIILTTFTKCYWRQKILEIILLCFDI